MVDSARTRIRDGLARFAIRHRIAYLIVIGGLTTVLGLGLRDLRIATVFSDLLPDGHEFVQVFRDHPDFGNPLTVQILVKRLDGDIYRADTLAKVWRITREAERLPGVDHERIVSIASSKARVAVSTPFGIESEPLMADTPPASREAIGSVRRNIERASGVVPFLVSRDHSATLVRVTFNERQIDYRDAFRRLRAIETGERDPRHDVRVSGLPMLIGWVDFHESRMNRVLAITMGAMILALGLYTRSIAATVTPLIVSGVSAVWGFGFVGWIGDVIEPLTMVVPVLLVARSFSHSIQVTERYREMLRSSGDRERAAEGVLSALLAPGTLGVLTDAAALFLIGVTPIPMMQKFALFSGFWALSILPANVLLSPILLSMLPVPGRIARSGKPAGRARFHSLILGLLSRVGGFSYGPRRGLVGAALLLALVGGAIAAGKLVVGNDTEGSPLLWESSEYNRGVRELNAHFPGMNTLELVFEGTRHSAMRSSDAIHTMRALQRHLESLENPPPATLSFADYLPEVNRLISGGNPKWLPIDRDERMVQGAINGLLLGANPKDFGELVDVELRNGVVRIWQKDLAPRSLERTISQARAALAQVGETHEGFRIRIGSGSVALEQAVNETVASYEWIVLGLLFAVIALTSSVAYGSMSAGAILLVPVAVSNLLLVLCMLSLGIGISVDTLPVTAIGVGIGVDYAIYLLTRICDESARSNSLTAAIDNAIGTSGKAIFFTGTIVLIGLLPWYFLADLKFQADMGLLLTLVMIINMLVALIVVPYLVYRFKPRFVVRAMT